MQRQNDIDPEELKTKLDEILSFDNFEDQKSELVKLGKNYSYIREESPYKELYWAAVKKMIDKDKLTVNGPNNFLNQINPHHYDNIDRSHEVDTSTFDSYNPRIKEGKNNTKNMRPELSLKDLNAKIERIFSILSSKKIISDELKIIAEEYPFVRVEVPYKTVYWDAVKKWHLMTDGVIDTDNIENGYVPKSHIPMVDVDLDKGRSPLYQGYTSDTTFEGKNNTKNMRKIQDFGLFLEAKKEAAPASGEVQREVKKIISEMFAYGKNIKFAGDQNGEPEYVEFEIDANDHKLSYDEDLYMEYSEGVLKKRKYQVSLKYSSKSKEGTDEKPIYKIIFKIKLKSAGEVEIKKDKKPDFELAWEFEKKPTEVISFIKSEKQKCQWNESDKVLYIKKSAYDRLSTAELKSLIREEGGVKVQA